MPLPLASVDKLIRRTGAYRVSEGAAAESAAHLEETAMEVARDAITMALHERRSPLEYWKSQETLITLAPYERRSSLKNKNIELARRYILD